MNAFPQLSSRIPSGSPLQIAAILFGLLACVTLAHGQAPAAGARAGATAGPAGPGLTLTTTAFQDGGEIPDKFTQAAATAVSPKLDWTNVPAGTVTFTLLVHDPDVSVNKTSEDILHWMVFNIPGTAHGLPEAVPAGPMADGSMQVVGRGGVASYRGPGAPAAGPQHHYTFELFALDAKLDLPAVATRTDVMKAMDGHIVGKAVLVGRFKRPAVAPAAK